MTLGHDDLAHRDALAGKEAEVLPVLDHPASVSELAVDQHAGTLLSRRRSSSITCPHPCPPRRHTIGAGLLASRVRQDR